jgi:hypothetical protein
MEQPTATNIPNVNLKPGNRKRKGRRSAPKAELRVIGKDRAPYAYIFNDPRTGPMAVLNSANGWWIGVEGQVKLQKLVDAYCFYMTDVEACSYAGITGGNLKYFQELHPDFYTIKDVAKSQPDIHAKKMLVQAASKDAGWAAWWISRTQKETFSTRIDVGGTNGRDLFDGLAQEIRQLGESLRNDNDDTATQEHTGELATGHTDAGEVGGGDATPASPDFVEAPSIPEQAR